MNRNVEYFDVLMMGFVVLYGLVWMLYDCWELMARRYANASCLGTRDVDAKIGMLGKYMFRMFVEVVCEWVVLGSVMVWFGIVLGSVMGLYSINTSEWVAFEAAMTR